MWLSWYWVKFKFVGIKQRKAVKTVSKDELLIDNMKEK